MNAIIDLMHVNIEQINERSKFGNLWAIIQIIFS